MHRSKQSEVLSEITRNSTLLIPYSSYSIRQNVPYKFTEIGIELFRGGSKILRQEIYEEMFNASRF